MSLGVAPGFNAQFGPVGIMGSGYYGTGLGMVSTQDGDLFTQSAADATGQPENKLGLPRPGHLPGDRFRKAGGQLRR